MRLYAFHCGGEQSMRSLFDPNDPDCGAPMLVPYFFFLIQHAGQNILFDTGMHPMSISDPARHFGEHADSYPLVMAPGDDAVSLLATVGVAPDDVGHIVQSHLHYDHAGGLTLFKRATVHLHRVELPFALWPPVYQRNPPQFIRHEFESITSWHEIEGDCDILGERDRHDIGLGRTGIELDVEQHDREARRRLEHQDIGDRHALPGARLAALIKSSA